MKNNKGFTLIELLVVVAIIDYIYQKVEYDKSLKMTKQEIKEEYKQTEGDPQIKSRMKQMQRELLKKKDNQCR